MSTNKTKLCGCCDSENGDASFDLSNTPGLANLIYRVGSHSTFKRAMIQALSQPGILKSLTTRNDDDPSIALIDAWAVVLDILTFYQERIINEGYMNTAKERLSLFELAKHISYRPKPGVAAHTYLAFSMDDAVGAPTQVEVNSGTKVQSIPGKDEKPQIFETGDSFQAKTIWNAIKPRLFKEQVLNKNDKALYLKGTTNQLEKGDAILIVGDEKIKNPDGERWDIRFIDNIALNEKDNYTKVSWRIGLGHDYPFIDPTAENQKVFVFRQRASLFGHNAPDARTMGKDIRQNSELVEGENKWVNFDDITPQDKTLDLDASYPKIVVNSWLALIKPKYTELYQIKETDQISRADFGVSGKITRLKIDSDENIELFRRRKTEVLAQSEALEMAAFPIESIVQGNHIVLDDNYSDLKEGQVLILSGALEGSKPSEDPIVPGAVEHPNTVYELIEIAAIDTEDSLSKIHLAKNLAHQYIRSTVTINANVAYATHGESKIESLGSGDASKSFQKFVLKQSPLTYIPASTTSGTDTTLEIRVDDILWKEVSTFYGRQRNERIYITRQEDDGSTYVQFGDGITGSRLPTGVENIKAIYRIGIGIDALLNAGQLSTLMTPQLGLRSVTNPLATADADDPESLENIRFNAPLTVLTMDRIVSITDFEDFTRAFAGIGKARADLMWKGENRIVHITVAGATADSSTVSDSLRENLSLAINSVRHSNIDIVINNFVPLLFGLTAAINVHRDYVAETVMESVRSMLLETFHFDNRQFTQNVTPSEIIAVMQSIEGVVYVDLNTLNNTDIFATDHFQLVARPARWEAQEIAPAELLTIDPNAITISLITNED